MAAEHSLRDVGGDTPALMAAAVKLHLLSILKVAVSYAPRPRDPRPGPQTPGPPPASAETAKEGAKDGGKAALSVMRAPLTCQDLFDSLQVRICLYIYRYIYYFRSCGRRSPARTCSTRSRCEYVYWLTKFVTDTHSRFYSVLMFVAVPLAHILSPLT